MILCLKPLIAKPNRVVITVKGKYYMIKLINFFSLKKGGGAYFLAFHQTQEQCENILIFIYLQKPSKALKKTKKPFSGPLYSHLIRGIEISLA